MIGSIYVFNLFLRGTNLRIIQKTRGLFKKYINISKKLRGLPKIKIVDFRFYIFLMPLIAIVLKKSS
jgi:hypothetical protein